MQRKSDGTVVIEGRRFEIPNRYRHLTRLEVRYAGWDLGLVHLVDERTGTVLTRLHPQDKTQNASGLAARCDFYREMGDLFGVELAPHNRWAGAKVLRDRWQTHIDAALSRPVLSSTRPRRCRQPCSPSCGCCRPRASTAITAPTVRLDLDADRRNEPPGNGAIWSIAAKCNAQHSTSRST